MRNYEVNNMGQFLFKLNHYLRYSYVYYYSREIKNRDDFQNVDTKLVLLYDVSFDRNLRASRKKKGIRNIIYIRYKNRFILLATQGFNHQFDKLSFLDFRVNSFLINGYSVKVKGSKPSIRLEKPRFEKAKAKAKTIAHHDVIKVTEFLSRGVSPFTFQGIQQQRWKLYQLINRRRKAGGLKPIHWEAINREGLLSRRKYSPNGLPSIKST